MLSRPDPAPLHAARHEPAHQPGPAWAAALLALWLSGGAAAAASRPADAGPVTTPSAAPAPATGTTPAGASPAGAVRLLVQSSLLAGYNFHQAARVFARLQPGDELLLEREPDNPHDDRAVRVLWGEYLLGYVPRPGNALVAWALDRGEPLGARISRLQRHRSPARRIEFEVYMD